MPSPTKITKIADLLARFEPGSVAKLSPSARHLLATAIVTLGRFPMGYELQDSVHPKPDRFISILKAFDGLPGLDQALLCARLGVASPTLFRQALDLPGTYGCAGADPGDAVAVLRLFRMPVERSAADDTGDAMARENFELGLRVTTGCVTAFLDRRVVTERQAALDLRQLGSAFADARVGWDFRIQDMLHLLGRLGVDPRKDAAFVTRRHTFGHGPGFLFLYPHPERQDLVTVLALPDRAPGMHVLAYRLDLDQVRARLAETLIPVEGTGPGEMCLQAPCSQEALERAQFLAFNLEAAGSDVPRNPFRRFEGLLPLLEAHLRLRDAIEAVLAE